MGLAYPDRSGAYKDTEMSATEADWCNFCMTSLLAPVMHIID